MEIKLKPRKPWKWSGELQLCDNLGETKKKHGLANHEMAMSIVVKPPWTNG
jgi:hypothetical protein